MNDDVQATLPFADCDTQEIINFFGHAEVTTENIDYLVDLAYGPNTEPLTSLIRLMMTGQSLPPFPGIPHPP